MTNAALSIVGLALSWIVGTTFNVFVQIWSRSIARQEMDRKTERLLVAIPATRGSASFLNPG